MAPATGVPPSASAMFTVKSPFFLMNSLVPSSGSTIHMRSQWRRSP